MRSAVLLLLLAAAAAALQTSLRHLLPVGVPVPDVLLVLCVFLGLRVHSPAGPLGAFGLGYLEDGIGGGPVGLGAFAFCAIYLTVHLTSRRLWVDNLLSKLVVVALASVVKAGIVAALLWAVLDLAQPWADLAAGAGAEAAVSAAIAPATFAAAHAAMRRPRAAAWG